MHASRDLLLINVYICFLFDFDGRIQNLIVFAPDHFLPFSVDRSISYLSCVVFAEIPDKLQTVFPTVIILNTTNQTGISQGTLFYQKYSSH